MQWVFRINIIGKPCQSKLDGELMPGLQSNAQLSISDEMSHFDGFYLVTQLIVINKRALGDPCGEQCVLATDL